MQLIIIVGVNGLEQLAFIQNIQDWSDQFPWLEMLTSLGILILLAALANFVAKQVVVRGLRKLISKMKFANSSIFAEHSVIRRIANIVPAIVIMNGITTVPHLSLKLVTFVQMGAQAFIFLTLALALSELLNIFNLIYQRNPKSKNKPIKGYLQLVKLMLYIVCALMILGTFLKKDVFTLLAGFGAMATVLMLVFQNTILSLVASVQISSYDMVRIGDWIEMPSLNADGDVIDMSLHTVTVQNFDKTFTTIPTNKLITDTFKNWRGMSNAGVRRIKRAIYIDQSTVHFMTNEEQQKLKDFLLLDQYLNIKESEIQKFNQQLGNQAIYNQRRLTNLGTFRAYIEFYLKQHPGIAQHQTIMVRQLQPTSEGLPLEIYAFSNTTSWVDYEAIQSDIFDHLIAIIGEFGLQVYQAPSGQDWKVFSNAEVIEHS
ncbi:mechanosensitive ion channel family protein [Acinetobacter radioresistens]|uniref:mechanosensitive ion channel family protein n=1 Tax=Acinetobacter radioresistens TaxID=40216 RepID=UPI000DAC0AC8|nr:mechanosensitive ion channel domain-containing protein [Acinetobacter radioresistens]AWV86265.1 mechanosensitive ion channel family protein [Acinetobacter radioresistens]MCK4100748.1 mechanosensitive ion channel [Acinetobacter radioresistens]MCK4108582.1 mechanosensitive ion channel [Acinetobacter radioresistens]MCX0329219.1 mechanosensitive ion channel family protein [Acinetobacter radioresistens]HCK64309.1 mechanosensitive ion channel protein MscS [Acinetobacter radioresistens]